MPSGAGPTVPGMAVNDWAEWRGTIALGQVIVAVAADAGLPGAGAAVELAVVGCADLDAWPRPPAHRLRWLRPRAGGERAYALLADALERTRLAALLQGGPDGPQVPLWALAGSLATADPPELAPAATPAAGPSDEELLLARALLRALPRRLPRADPAPTRAAPLGGVVVALDAARLRRAARPAPPGTPPDG